MTDFENKPAAGVPGPREGASARPGGGSRETVLLGDVPDVAQPPAETGVSSPNNSGLATNVLAALGQRYEILGEAGHGSMGNVYKARDRETGETVALKLLKPEIASDQAMMDRFKNELLFARKITHKNVCRVYEFNRAAGIAYTSMEFVEGESLRSVLNRFGALTQKKAKDLALQICSGLKEAHAQGIVHRDLKPENVMIDGSGNLKIMDFGIARSMEAVTRQTGAMVGTPAYMAPEQVSGSPVDYRTDIYSLGLMLYEMFTGKPAFSAENAIAVALKQMREDPAPPRTIDPSIPVPLERIMLKCLAKEPAKRFQTVADLESALQTPSAAATLPPPIVAPAVAAAHALRPTPVAAAPLSAPPRKSTAGPTVFWILFGSALVLAMLAGLRWLPHRQNLPSKFRSCRPARRRDLQRKTRRQKVRRQNPRQPCNLRRPRRTPNRGRPKFFRVWRSHPRNTRSLIPASGSRRRKRWPIRRSRPSNPNRRNNMISFT